MPIIATIGDGNIIGNTVSQANLTVLGQYSNLVGNLIVAQTSNLFTLYAGGQSNLIGNVGITGNTFHLNNTYFTNANVSGISNLNTLGIIGQANVLSTLGVTGQSNLLSTLGVTGQANLLSALGVTGQANLLSTLGVTGATWLLSTLNVSSNINTASNLSVQNWSNLFTLSVSSNANLQQNVMVLGTTTLLGNVNINSSNTILAGTINVAGTSNINNSLSVTGQTNLMSGANLFSTLYVAGQSNLIGVVGLQGSMNAFANITVGGNVNVFTCMNVLSNLGVVGTANLQTLNVYAASNLNQSLTVIGGSNLYSYLNAASLVVPGNSNLAFLGVANNLLVSANLIVNGNSNMTGQINSLSNISTPANIIVGSNIVSGAGGSNQGNVLMSGNLVVQGNIYFTSGALGTIGGLTLTSTSNIQLSTPFSADANGNAYSLTLTPFQIKGTSAFIYVSSGGNIKFQLPGTYVLSGFFPGDATVLKVAVGSSATDTHPTTKNYFYIQSFSVQDRFNIPLVITDQTQYYYIDVYTNQGGSNLAPTYATLGSNSGTFVSVTPHGTFIPQALNYPQTWTNVIGSSNIYNFGSVGIGTTNPQSNLAVVGSMSLGSYSYTGVTAPANSFIVSGIAGIGTATPSANLYVVGNIVSTTNVTSVGFANVGSILINGTQLIDTNRNFTNVGTMSTGVITSTQAALAGFTNIVYRQPLWGTGSRIGGFRVSIPYGISEVDSTTISYLNIPFNKSTAATGSVRRYRVFITYMLYPFYNGSASFKIRCYASGGGTYDFVLTTDAVTATNVYQDSVSGVLTITDTSANGQFVLRANPSNFSGSSPFNIEIDYLELQTIDQY